MSIFLLHPKAVR